MASYFFLMAPAQSTNEQEYLIVRILPYLKVSELELKGAFA